MSSDNEGNSAPEPLNLHFPERGTRGLHILFEPKHPRLDIIFLHGLNGDSYNTWLHKKSKVYWPRDILPNDLLEARIMTYGYDANILRLLESASQTNIRIEADKLFRTLTNGRNIDGTNDREIIWIAHSLGGIILKKVLHLSTQDKDYFRKQLHCQTVGIMFLGTPHKGSELASPASAILKGVRAFTRTNVNLLNALKKNSALLDEYHRTFLVWLRERKEEGNQPMIISYYEMLEYIGAKLIVRQESATMDDYPSQPIYANHENMVRFESEEDFNYQSIKNELFYWTQSLNAGRGNPPMINRKIYNGNIELLAFEEMGHRYFDVDRHAEGTCQWIIDHEQFKNWRANRIGILYLSGKPGAGKSTIIKYLVNHFRYHHEHHIQGKIVAVLSFMFNGRGSDIQKSASGMFRSFLCQILKQTASPLPELAEALDDKKLIEGRVNWKLNELKELFEISLASMLDSKDVIILVDALDESGEDVAVSVSEYFQKLTRRDWGPGSKLGICFSCRHYPLLSIGSCPEITIEKENSKDIVTFVNSELPDENWKKVAYTIAERADGLFIWAVLVTQQVKKLLRKGRIKEARNEPYHNPMGLFELYSQLLKNLTQEEKEISLKYFRWAYFAFYPVSVKDYGFAMRLNPANQSQTMREIVEEMESLEKTVTDLSCGLLESREHPSSVQFIHESAKDFLLEKGFRILDGSLNSTSLIICKGHAYMLKCCIHLLLKYNRQACSSTFNCDDDDNIYQYASKYWIEHALKTEVEIGCNDNLALSMNWPSEPFVRISDQEFSGAMIYRTLERRMTRVASYLTLTNSASLNYRHESDETLLLLASKSKIPAVLELLLHSGADPKVTDNKQANALHYAAGSNCFDSLQSILKYNDDINSRDKYSETPLFYLARYGREDVDAYNPRAEARTVIKKSSLYFYNLPAMKIDENVAKVLLDHGASVDVRNRFGFTPLMEAVARGSLELTTLLLERGAEVNVRDNKCWTPLVFAIRLCANEAVVRLLLDWNADVDSRNHDGRTPLSMASDCFYRSYEKMELLLERGAQVDSCDNHGRMPLSWASYYRSNSHKKIQLLLKWGA